MGLEADTTKRLEAILSPKQLTALKEDYFGQQAADAMDDAELAKKIGVTEQEKAPARQLTEEFQRNQASLSRASWSKVLALLNAARKNRLREECDRRASW
jgi:hypothetical protein